LIKSHVLENIII